jgi:hypothetical protein
MRQLAQPIEVCSNRSATDSHGRSDQSHSNGVESETKPVTGTFMLQRTIQKIQPAPANDWQQITIYQLVMSHKRARNEKFTTLLLLQRGCC